MVLACICRRWSLGLRYQEHEPDHRGAGERGADPKSAGRAEALPEEAGEQAGGKEHRARRGVIEAKGPAAARGTGKVGDERTLRAFGGGMVEAVEPEQQPDRKGRRCEREAAVAERVDGPAPG